MAFNNPHAKINKHKKGSGFSELFNSGLSLATQLNNTLETVKPLVQNAAEIKKNVDEIINTPKEEKPIKQEKSKPNLDQKVIDFVIEKNRKLKNGSGIYDM